MSIKRQAAQWTKYIVGAVIMLIVTLALTDYLSGGEDVAGIGLPLLFVFILAAKAYGNYLGIGS
ncbi:hypothetical protein SAMN04487948_1427 [Halogranum amylolyticum]|uniref:Uncharacterized protein n=1 Tax=Halogranum amylolyticum TaxID=660520 RepID=A0A1H8WTC7_9EURY|nr:hypothetical protein [Halogranum amylolyticum]SEP30940.1 hypothetical protein SAMN04487948_1427 [Halogranum amylolyticum]